MKYVDSTELDTFAQGFSINANSFKSWLKQWSIDKANKILEETKTRTPVDTGKLLASWQEPKVELSGNVIVITFENTAYYSGWVEYGHNKPYHACEPQGGPNWVDGRFMITVPLEDFINDVSAVFSANFVDYMLKKV